MIICNKCRADIGIAEKSQTLTKAFSVAVTPFPPITYTDAPRTMYDAAIPLLTEDRMHLCSTCQDDLVDELKELLAKYKAGA